MEASVYPRMLTAANWGFSILAAMSGILVLLGLVVLVGAAMVRWSLDFDYTSSIVTAEASFISDLRSKTEARWLRPGQHFSVDLDLILAEPPASFVLQVTGDLLTADGNVTYHSTKPVLLQRRSWFRRSLWGVVHLDWGVVLGLWEDSLHEKVSLISDQFLGDWSWSFLFWMAVFAILAGVFGLVASLVLWRAVVVLATPGTVQLAPPRASTLSKADSVVSDEEDLLERHREVIRDYESQEEQESCAQQLAVQDDWSDTISSTTTGQRGPEDVLALGPTGGKGAHLSRTSSARFRGKRSS
eukprot:jgi/Astpho2/2842/Aster-01001